MSELIPALTATTEDHFIPPVRHERTQEDVSVFRVDVPHGLSDYEASVLGGCLRNTAGQILADFKRQRLRGQIARPLKGGL